MTRQVISSGGPFEPIYGYSGKNVGHRALWRDDLERNIPGCQTLDDESCRGAGIARWIVGVDAGEVLQETNRVVSDRIDAHAQNGVAILHGHPS